TKIAKISVFFKTYNNVFCYKIPAGEIEKTMKTLGISMFSRVLFFLKCDRGVRKGQTMNPIVHLTCTP
ncbi:hypothetical protein, partial [Streptococcus suis]|uniref:hypothetical protein n=1 Tax=Streptococcus suis TaxID=1307 RepID=UPI001C8C35D7